MIMKRLLQAAALCASLASLTGAHAVTPGAAAPAFALPDHDAKTVSLASLRGRVTLSYATSATLDGREGGPSPLMLEAWREAINTGGENAVHRGGDMEGGERFLSTIVTAIAT